MSDSIPLIPRGIGNTPDVERRIGQWVRQHEANQREGNALTDAVKNAGVIPEGTAQQPAAEARIAAEGQQPPVTGVVHDERVFGKDRPAVKTK